ncbi:MAG TPA: helix-turn-helix transcriptional regulator [Solirubrobacterales bacterium]|nr:helix-turn-helix transcriptional regulator [Solirubrobacterales bacterium]
MTAPRKEAPDVALSAGDDDPRLVYEQERLFSQAIETLAGLVEEQGISQRELATRVGRDQAQISRLLGGAGKNANLKTVARIGWALGIRLVIVGVPFESRDGTPAADDPPLPEWLDTQRERRAGESPATEP